MRYNTTSMQLVVFTGLPGTGKSTLAEYAAQVLQCPVFSKDRLEATLWRSGIKREANSGWAAYELLTTMAEGQLQLGQSVILDSVVTSERLRSVWRTLGVQYGAAFRVVECICSDRELHQRRLIGRTRGIPGWHELSWDDVEHVRTEYEPWQEKRLVLDAVDSPDSNRDVLCSYLLG